MSSYTESALLVGRVAVDSKSNVKKVCTRCGRVFIESQNYGRLECEQTIIIASKLFVFAADHMEDELTMNISCQDYKVGTFTGKCTSRKILEENWPEYLWTWRDYQEVDCAVIQNYVGLKERAIAPPGYVEEFFASRSQQTVYDGDLKVLRSWASRYKENPITYSQKFEEATGRKPVQVIYQDDDESESDYSSDSDSDLQTMDSASDSDSLPSSDWAYSSSDGCQYSDDFDCDSSDYSSDENDNLFENRPLKSFNIYRIDIDAALDIICRRIPKYLETLKIEESKLNTDDRGVIDVSEYIDIPGKRSDWARECYKQESLRKKMSYIQKLSDMIVRV